MSSQRNMIKRNSLLPVSSIVSADALIFVCKLKSICHARHCANVLCIAVRACIVYNVAAFNASPLFSQQREGKSVNLLQFYATNTVCMSCGCVRVYMWTKITRKQAK